jgi:hypothetical protein
MMKNSPIEDELDAIRLALYEQTKGMSNSEMTEFIKRQIAPTVKKYNIPAKSGTRSNSSYQQNSEATL